MSWETANGLLIHGLGLLLLLMKTTTDKIASISTPVLSDWYEAVKYMAKQFIDGNPGICMIMAFQCVQHI